MNYDGELAGYKVVQRTHSEPDCAPHPFDVVAAYALYQSWTLRISSGVSKGIDKSVVQSGRDFPYIRVGGGQ